MSSSCLNRGSVPEVVTGYLSGDISWDLSGDTSGDLCGDLFSSNIPFLGFVRRLASEDTFILRFVRGFGNIW